MKLSEAVDFDSQDGEAVDLVFGLMVPAELGDEDQANICSIAELLGDLGLRARLRAASTSNDLYDTLCA
jgi:PTS system nitrogen regulatory IIA component